MANLKKSKTASSQAASQDNKVVFTPAGFADGKQTVAQTNVAAMVPVQLWESAVTKAVPICKIR
jgi:hypothetical protein